MELQTSKHFYLTLSKAKLIKTSRRIGPGKPERSEISLISRRPASAPPAPPPLSTQCVVTGLAVKAAAEGSARPRCASRIHLHAVELFSSFSMTHPGLQARCTHGSVERLGASQRRRRALDSRCIQSKSGWRVFRQPPSGTMEHRRHSFDAETARPRLGEWSPPHSAVFDNEP